MRVMGMALICLFIGGTVLAADALAPDMERMFSAPTQTAQALKREGSPTSKVWLGYMVASGMVSESAYGSATILYRQALDDYRNNPHWKDVDHTLWDDLAPGKINAVTRETPASLSSVRWIFDLLGGVEVPCALLRAKKKDAFEAFGGVWGGGRDAVMRFCTNGSMDEIAEVRDYISTLSRFNGHTGYAGGGECWYGTMERDRPMHQERQRLLWSYDPPLDISDTVPYARDMETGLAYWSVLERGNRDYLVKDVGPAEQAAAKALEGFYRRQGLLADKAQVAAGNAVVLLKLQNYGAFPQSLLEKIAPAREGLLHPEQMMGRLSEISSTAVLDALLSRALVEGEGVEVLGRIQARRDALGAHFFPADFPDGKGPSWGEPLLGKAQNAETTRWLLKGLANAWQNKMNGFGKTPLMYAIQRNDIESVKALLEAGADPNLPTYALSQIKANDEVAYCYEYRGLEAGNRTPLMYAAWHAGADMVETLLKSGANPKLTDDHGQTACDYIARNDLPGSGHGKMKSLLCK